MMIFRRMEPKDLRAVAQLEQLCFSEPWSENAFRDALDKECYRFYVAYDDEEHVGTVGMVVSYDEADITNVAVSESRRRGHIGGRLLKYALQDAMSAGIMNFTLEVRTGNAAAISLYQKYGFVGDGIRPGFYSNPKEDALIMWRRNNREC